MLPMPVALASFFDCSVNIWLRLAPDQNLASKRSATDPAVLIANHLRKIMVQESTEAAKRSSMTSCTGSEACLIRLHRGLPGGLVGIRRRLRDQRSGRQPSGIGRG